MNIKDIAKLAGVSISTVSKVINGKDHDISEQTKMKVKKIIQENHYIPNTIARSMVTKKTKTIGLIIPDICNPFFTTLARGCEDECETEGYNLFICNTDEQFSKEQKYLNLLMERQVEGIILIGASERNQKTEEALRINVPLIIVDRHVHYENIKCTVTINNVLGGIQAAEHLIELNHKNILILAGPKTVKPAMERIKSFTETCEKSGKGIKLFELETEFNDKDAYNAILKNVDIIKKEEITAIFATNDLIAIGAIKGLNKLGFSVPQDISVIGFDNIGLSELIAPELTTINQPMYEVGQHAIRQLFEVINNKKVKNSLILNTQLILRDSTNKYHS